MLNVQENFIVRAPMLPFEDRDWSLTQIKKEYSDPSLQEAIYIGSPDLFKRIPDFLNGSLDTREAERIRVALMKYLLRATSRCTPFGLFATVSTGRWSNQTQARLDDRRVRLTRLDADFVSKLVATLVRDPRVSSKLKHFANDTIYHTGNKVRYIDMRTGANGREHFLTDVEFNPHLDSVLREAKHGATKDELAQSIIGDEISFDDAYRFVEELIEYRLITSELEFRLTGEDYFTHLSNVFAKRNISIPGLSMITDILSELDRGTSHQNLSRYPLIESLLSEVVGTQLSEHLIQTDSYRDAHVHVNSLVATVIENTSKLVASLGAVNDRPSMKAFIERFVERYDTRTVDLCTALDPELGIGYPVMETDSTSDSALLKPITFVEKSPDNNSGVSPFHKFLLTKYVEAVRNNSEIVLTASELQPFLNDVPLPSSLYAFVTVLTSSEEDLDRGEFFVKFNGAYGPSGATLIARFCHLDNSILEMTKRSIEMEESVSNAVFAEVVHVNQNRIANISTRPALRQYEIPILASSGVDQDHVIPLSDLTLRVRGGRLIVASKRLKSEVIPRLSSAHNFSNETIAAYRFLCDVQFRGVKSSITFDLGPMKSFSYLPRIRMDKAILSPARWQLSAEHLNSIHKSVDLLTTMEQLRSKLKLPRYVLVGDDDNKIPIDLEDENQLAFFRKVIDSASVLEEFLAKDRMFLKDKEGRSYVNELIVPMTSTTINREFPLAEDDINDVRDFYPGSEWIYYKIYCTPKSSERLLLDLVLPLTRKLAEERVTDQWFFIRYADPRHHIRLRFHGSGDFYKVVMEVMNQGIKPYLDSGAVWNITVDTYRREIERYGRSIVETEELFFLDSHAILNLLPYFVGDDDLRWTVALVLVDQLLTSFRLPDMARCVLVADARQFFVAEFKVDKNGKMSIDKSRRERRELIERALNENAFEEEVTAIIQERGERLRPVVKKILMGYVDSERFRVNALIRDYVHMTVNRLFQSNQREHEMVIYDYLYHFYESKMAREKYKVS